MADDADRAQINEEVFEEAKMAEIRRRAQAIPKGEPGRCKLCGEDMPRLVNGVCATCRDKHKLP